MKQRFGSFVAKTLYSRGETRNHLIYSKGHYDVLPMLFRCRAGDRRVDW